MTKREMNRPQPQYGDDYMMGKGGPVKTHEVTTKPPKQPKMHSANPGKLPSAGRGRSKMVGASSASQPAGPTSSSGEGKAYGNRNFGRDDHHGTTNVRSRPSVNSPGPGGSKHISNMPARPAGVGSYLRGTMASGNTSQHPPYSTAPNDMDADDRESPPILSAVPLHSSEGGFG